MTKLEIAKLKMKFFVGAMNTEQIIAAWNHTEKNFDETSPIIRGAIMDRLEKENAEKFWTWVDSDDQRIENFFN